jgi:predicted anti-sigma-YlaC factor YlaD
MDCRDFRKMLSREIDGEIDHAEEASLAAHLEVCESCRRARAVLREATALHRDLVELEPPLSLANDVMASIVEPERRGRLTGFFRVAVPIAAAVVLVLGIYAGIFLGDLITQPGVNGNLAVLELEYLDEFPPGSAGDVIMTATEGGDDE